MDAMAHDIVCAWKLESAKRDVPMVDPKMQNALIEIERESEQVQAAIDELIGEMERVPAEQRSVSEWGPAGTLTTRFLELTDLQNDLAERHKKLSRAVATAALADDAAPPPAKPN